MDFSKLDGNDKLAVYGSVAVIVAGIVATSTYSTYGVAWVSIIAAIAMLAIVFLPQLSPNTTLPGSRGSLMLLAGGVAAALMALALLVSLSFVFFQFGFGDLMFLVAVAGGLLMGWAGWQAFQAEGGKFQIGTTSGSSAAPAVESAPPAEPAAPSFAPAEPTPEAPAGEEQGSVEGDDRAWRPESPEAPAATAPEEQTTGDEPTDRSNRLP